MWVTLFALATAASVWFSAANLAIQLRKEPAAFNLATESREQTSELPNQRFSLTEAGSRASLNVQLD